MNTTPPQIPPVVDDITPAAESKWTVQRIAMIAAGALIGLILLVFVAGVLLAVLTNAEQTAPRIQIIRDIFIIILSLQGILIIVALAVLVLQVARLINLVQTEIKPILENAQETLTTAKGTVEFVGKNVTEPVLYANGFLAGFVVLFRELFGLRRALRRRGDNESAE